QMRSDWVLPICGGQERLKQDGHKVHPTQKPEALLYRVMLATTEAGDVVLDPFFGTGTTGAVAKRLGRQWIGCEREAGYREAALARIAKELPLDESALETMQSKRNAPKVAFGALVEAGFLAPGAELFDKQRRWTATVRADGSIVSGRETGSIHGVGKGLEGAPGRNGVAFWHGGPGGQVQAIDALRQLFLLAVEDWFSANARRHREVGPAAEPHSWLRCPCSPQGGNPGVASPR